MLHFVVYSCLQHIFKFFRPEISVYINGEKSMEDKTGFPGGKEVAAVESSIAVEGTRFYAAAGGRKRLGPPSNFLRSP